MRTIFLAAACAALAISSGSAAKPLATEQFKAKADIQIDPTKAYLLVRSPGIDLKLLKVPTDAERQEYAKERAEALVKAKQKYVRSVEKYERDLATSREINGPPPEKPVEPTDENFAYKAIESDNFATVWGGRVFDKSAERTAHLIAVPPGTYRIYGQILEAPNGSSAGTCLCMGSVQFDAAAGTITDMGTIHYPLEEAAAKKVDASWNGLTPGKGGLTFMRVEPADGSVSVPAKLSSMPRVSASYRAAGKIDNFFGAMIGRLTPLPGVLSYKRDEVIDERTGTPLAAR